MLAAMKSGRGNVTRFRRRKRSPDLRFGAFNLFRRHRGKAGLAANGVAYLLLAFVAWGFSGHARLATAGDEFSGGVARVVDGDTFRITSRREAIRLWGADAPETDEPGGAEATAALKRLALGKRVHCKQMARDRYGRIVARCLPDNGDDIDELLIESGAVAEYVRFTGGFYAQRRLMRWLKGEG